MDNVDLSCDSGDTASQSWSVCPSLDERPTDLDLYVEGCCFHVHKDVLEQSCDYFKAMFQSQMLEQTKREIKLHSVQCEPFKVLVEAFYSGSLSLNTSNMFSVAETLQMLQVKETLSDQCIEYFQQTINYDNCFEILFFADQYSIQDIYDEARRFCLAYFIEVWHHSSFSSLTSEQLVNFLSDENLCVDHEAEVLQALKKWFHKNPSHQDKTAEILSSCLWLRDHPKALEITTKAVISADSQLFQKEIPDIFASRPRQESVLMFWSLLTSTEASGLVDLVKLCPDTSRGLLLDSMRTVLELPGCDVGSALCCRGPYVYLSGGGPGFGKVNWIRKLWRFDCSCESDRWQAVGELFETRRHHAMVAIGNKLYIFGGFGKFRVKNSELDCFDLEKKSWHRLQQMPTHEIKPVTAVHYNTFYYIDSGWEVYAFSSDTERWSMLDRSALLKPVPTCPVAIHIVPGVPLDYFVVLAQDERLHLSVFRRPHSGELGTALYQDSLECEGKLKYSVVESRRLLIFLERKDEDFGAEDMSGDEEFSIMVKSYDVGERKLSEYRTLRNIKKAQNVVTVPELPVSFRIGAPVSL
ncbi:kelch-like protein 21 [Aplysia californica]|uniref:Kelch-like protein 21 n=1 Tax=Aplysia californica TaxID=6500 RepID=A0ABM0K6A5_APLCA|nr:kelch-like protein 21 [Aplysia californica]